MIQWLTEGGAPLRLTKERIGLLAKTLVEGLLKGGAVAYSGKKEALVRKVENMILQEMAVEERLNAEVEEILKSHQREIEKGNVDYHRMFQMVKSQLVKERGIIL